MCNFGSRNTPECPRIQHVDRLGTVFILIARYSSANERYSFRPRAFRRKEVIAHTRGPGGTSVLFLIVHRTWTWLDRVARLRVVGPRRHPHYFYPSWIGVGGFVKLWTHGERTKSEQRTVAGTETVAVAEGKKKHDDGPGIEPVSNLH